MIQLRAKGIPSREFFQLAVETRRHTSAAGCLFIVNDRLDIALSTGADGVHLGQGDLPLAVARRLMGDRGIGISTHDLDQAKVECGDLMWLEARGTFRWDMAHELQEVVAGRLKGRPSEQSITLFESMGVGLEDIAAAQLVYRKAKEQGIGQELPF